MRNLINPARLLITPTAVLSSVLSASFVLPVTAQDFNLFEEVETTSSSQPDQRRPDRESRATISRPEFTLVGTSRIGSRYTVILADRDNQKLVVPVEPDTSVGIPGYDDYLITATAKGRVSIRHPDIIPCVEFPDSGVHCNSASNIAELSLPNFPPVAAQPQISQAAQVQGEEQNAEAIEENPDNPFAIMRNRMQNGENIPDETATAASDGNARFVPRRIDPSEVPPGMRIVSTPFGDRLVQQ